MHHVTLHLGQRAQRHPENERCDRLAVLAYMGDSLYEDKRLLSASILSDFFCRAKFKKYVINSASAVNTIYRQVFAFQNLIIANYILQQV